MFFSKYVAMFDLINHMFNYNKMLFDDFYRKIHWNLLFSRKKFSDLFWEICRKNYYRILSQNSFENSFESSVESFINKNSDEGFNKKFYNDVCIKFLKQSFESLEQITNSYSTSNKNINKKISRIYELRASLCEFLKKNELT
jgi:hypothetical protein